MRSVGTFLLVFCSSLCALPLEAQVRGGRMPSQPQDTIRGLALTIHGLMYLRFEPFFDPPTQTRWIMADAAMGGGGALHAALGDGFWLGLEAATARTRYERRPRQGTVPEAQGHANVTTVLASVRLGGSGLGRLGGLGSLGYLGRAGYLSVGGGAINYRLEDLDGSTTDMLFSTAGGLEYAWPSGRTVYLELRRFWAFHEREGVESATANHSRIDVGARAPLRR